MQTLHDLAARRGLRVRQATWPSALRLIGLALAVLLALPRLAHADDTSSTQVAANVAKRRQDTNTRIAAGLAIFAFSYGISAGIAFTHRSERYDTANELFLPVVGPVISVVKFDRQAQGRPGLEGLATTGISLPIYALLAVDAVAQGAGLVVFATGVAGWLSTPRRAPSRAVTVRPCTTGGTVGLAGYF